MLIIMLVKNIFIAGVYLYMICFSKIV